MCNDTGRQGVIVSGVKWNESRNVGDIFVKFSVSLLITWRNCFYFHETSFFSTFSEVFLV